MKNSEGQGRENDRGAYNMRKLFLACPQQQYSNRAIKRIRYHHRNKGGGGDSIEHVSLQRACFLFQWRGSDLMPSIAGDLWHVPTIKTAARKPVIDWP